ncbi:hypothetical protein RsY01_370 [Lactococcus reticulitermitis]|uniref:VRR-NUC domain-containing protein n=2 Tax=Pseudolactococcus reticulitermitis TaxID=2025039 RepID=A0A224X5H8_9LACT|nr:VRR-NUC domain-containing protein [Lactococcus reticulitermitis]GAX46790.1 hypothetical protein RsY01_370 [Lactococcus reticulitermitis]
MQLENDVEKRLINKVKALGGITFKFTSPSTKGVPDRIIIYGGQTVFVELKRPGKEPNALQRYWLKELEYQKISTAVVSTFYEVDELMADLQKRGDYLHGS